ncbi:MAG: YciI family protein [Chloroherpetonaceae bacterium]|nr:YciI family protein [Chloroherpetonaceae bacterium]
MSDQKMFVAVGEYLKPLSEVEAHYSKHSEWLVRNYESGAFLASGRQFPPTGGLILAKASSLAQATTLFEEDPLVHLGIARYSLIEFTPGDFPRRSPEFDAFFKKAIK